MTNLITLFLIFGFIVSPAFAKKKQTVIEIYGDNNYAPYSYTDEKKNLIGIYPEILREAFKLLPEYKLKLKAIPWKRGLSRLEKGKINALFPPYFRVEERPYIWPYSLAILEEEVVVVCNKKMKAKAKWPNDFIGLSIGRNRGFSTGGPEWDKLVKTKKIKDSEVDTIDSGLIMLSKKRIDCYMNDRISIFWTLKNLVKSKKVSESDASEVKEIQIISRERGFVGYSHKWDDKTKEDVIKKIDGAIHQIRKSGKIYSIQQKYSN